MSIKNKYLIILTNERRVSGSYFCTHISHLLDFDMDDMVSFDTKYFFVR